MSKGSKNTRTLAIVSVLLIVIPAFFIVSRLLEYQAADKTQEKIAALTAQYTIMAPAITEIGQTAIPMEAFIDIEGLKEVNPETEGYIRIEGTNIDYPVMRSEERDKYLKRDFFGSRSSCGSIFMDNASYKGGTNLVLYGHNMKSGQMFGELDRYLDYEYAINHSLIRYITSDEIQEYEICSVFRAEADDEKLYRNLIPYTKKEMEALVAYEKEHADAHYDAFGWGDKLITLTTCEYTKKDGRLFVMGKLVNTIKRKGETNGN